MIERYIGENTRLIYDIMNYTYETLMSRLLLILDFEKAFGITSWKFINKTLDVLNFGESVKKTGRSCDIMIFNHLWFKVEFYQINFKYKELADRITPYLHLNYVYVQNFCR